MYNEVLCGTLSSKVCSPHQFYANCAAGMVDGERILSSVKRYFHWLWNGQILLMDALSLQGSNLENHYFDDLENDQ